MADRVLFIGWGQTVRGREERALEVFNEAIGLYGRMQQDGRIEKLDVCLLEPHGGGLAGQILLHGSAEQLSAVQEDAEFRQTMADALMVTDELGVVRGRVNEGVADQIAMFQAAIAKVPQSA